MMERIAEASPRPRARITGVVYLLYFLTAILAVFFIKGLVVSGDAAATAKLHSSQIFPALKRKIVMPSIGSLVCKVPTLKA
jgi:hypothetical protein